MLSPIDFYILPPPRSVQNHHLYLDGSGRREYIKKSENWIWYNLVQRICAEVYLNLLYFKFNPTLFFFYKVSTRYLLKRWYAIFVNMATLHMHGPWGLRVCFQRLVFFSVEFSGLMTFCALIILPTTSFGDVRNMRVRLFLIINSAPAFLISYAGWENKI